MQPQHGERNRFEAHSSEQRLDCIIVAGRCMNQNVNIFMDSGSTLSLVSSRFIYYHALENDVLPTDVELSSFSNDNINIEGEIVLDLEVAGTKIEHTFIVSPLLQDSDFLIGLDIMKEHSFSIAVGERKVYTPQGAARFLCTPRQLKTKLKVKCSKTVTLQPNTVNYIICEVKTRAKKHSFAGVLEPHRNLLTSIGVVAASALCYTDQNKVIVSCVNVSDEPATIYQGKYMGLLAPVQINSPTNHYISRVNVDSDTGSRNKTHYSVNEGSNEYFTQWDNCDDLFNRLGIDEVDIDDREKQELKALIKEFSYCFSKDRFDLGKCTFYKATITLKREYTPRWIPSRCLPYSQHEYMTKELDNLEKAGIIKPCDYSLWNSQIFLVPKPKQQDYRVICDLRVVNLECIPDSFQLPRVNNILDHMADSKYFSSFDFTSSFNQIEYDEESKKILAFTWNAKRYMHCRLTQGHLSSSSQFSRMMTQLFNKVPFMQLCFFVDDLLVASTNFRTHLERLRYVFERFAYANLKVNPAKTKLVRPEVSFLGLSLSSRGVNIDKDKLKAVKELKAPDTVKKVQSVLGFFNFSRQFIPRYANTARPLYDLLKKNTKFVWSSDCESAFQTMKQAMINHPTLALPDLNASFTIHVDSSSIGMGAILSQTQNGEPRIISYWSKAVAPHMRFWPSSHLEFVAMYKALMHWKVYLQGSRRVQIMTDCKSLCNFATIFAKANAHFQRMLANLAYYNLEIKHISGKSNVMADFLSRYPFKTGKHHKETQTSATQNNVAHYVADKVCTVQRASRVSDYKPITLPEIRTAQSTDLALARVKSWLEAGEKSKDFQQSNEPRTLCSYWRQFKLFHLKSKIIYRKYYNNDGTSRDLIVVPESLYERVMSMYHRGLEGGHAGVENSVQACKLKYWFSQMQSEFDLFIGSCLICNEIKQPKRYLRAEMTPIVYTEFNQCIAIDHIVPNREKATARRNRYVLTIVDMFSGYIVAVPTKTQTSTETIQILFEHWFCKYGFPLKILADNHQGFQSDLFKAVSETFGIKATRSTPWHSITNGRCEAANKKINAGLRAALSESNMNNWDVLLKFVVMTLNSLKNSRTNISPFFLVHGRHRRLPRDLFIEDPQNLKQPLTSSQNTERRLEAYSLHRTIRSVCLRVQEHAQRHVQYTCDSYKRQHSCKLFDFKKGDLCYVKVEVPKYGKWDIRWSGPWKILEKYTEYLYLIQVDKISKVLNISKIKPYKVTKYSPPELSHTKFVDHAQQTPNTLEDEVDNDDDPTNDYYIGVPLFVPGARSHRSVVTNNGNQSSAASDTSTIIGDSEASTPGITQAPSVQDSDQGSTSTVDSRSVRSGSSSSNGFHTAAESANDSLSPTRISTDTNNSHQQVQDTGNTNSEALQSDEVNSNQGTAPSAPDDPIVDNPVLVRNFDSDESQRRYPTRTRNPPNRFQFDPSTMPRIAFRRRR